MQRHRCPFHREVLVDRRTGYRVNQECLAPGMDAAVQPFLVLSPDVNFWASKQFPNLQLSPPFHPKCLTRTVERGKIQILTPENTTYLLHAGLGKTAMDLPLKVKTADLSNQWSCFLNGKPVDKRKDLFDPILRLHPGSYELFCIDAQGRSDLVAFNIEK